MANRHFNFEPAVCVDSTCRGAQARRHRPPAPKTDVRPFLQKPALPRAQVACSD